MTNCHELQGNMYPIQGRKTWSFQHKVWHWTETMQLVQPFHQMGWQALSMLRNSFEDKTTMWGIKESVHAAATVQEIRLTKKQLIVMQNAKRV